MTKFMSKIILGIVVFCLQVSYAEYLYDKDITTDTGENIKAY